MTPPDPRDDEFIATIAAAVAGMIRAVHHDDPEGATRELGRLLAAIVEHKKTMTEGPSDEALRRAVGRLGGLNAR